MMSSSEPALTAVEQVIQQATGRLDRRLFVIAGPSGVGKNTIIRELLASHPEIARVKTYTTRPARNGEVEGEQYFFRTEDEFKQLAYAGQLMEADANKPLGHDVYGTDHAYSMPIDIYRDIPANIHLVVAEVDVVGAELLRERYPTCVTIFVTAPPLDLLERIRHRPDDDLTHSNLAQRMETAQKHIQAAKDFHYVVYNEKDKISQAIAAVEQIIAVERMKVRNGFDLEAIIPPDAFDVVEKKLTLNGDS